MPTVFIHMDLDLESLFDSIMRHLDAKYHQFGTSFTDFSVTDEQQAQIDDMNVWASNVDFVPGDGHHVY